MVISSISQNTLLSLPPYLCIGLLSATLILDIILIFKVNLIKITKQLQNNYKSNYKIKLLLNNYIT